MNQRSKKQLAGALQALCLGSGLLTAGLAPAVSEAATITATTTYSNQGGTISDDINITDGYISATASSGNPVISLIGEHIYINQGSNAYALMATATKEGCGNGGMADIKINDGGTSTVQIVGNVETDNNGSLSGGRIFLYLTNADSYLAGKLVRNSGTIFFYLNDGAVWYVPEGNDSYNAVGCDAGPIILDAAGGYIDLYHVSSGTARSTAAGMRTFSVAGLSASGGEALSLKGATFVLSSDIKNGHTDKVILTNVSGNSNDIAKVNITNNYFIQIAYDPAMGADGTYTTASDLTILTTDSTNDTVTAKSYATTRTEAAGLKTVSILLTPTLSTSNGVTKLTALTVKNTDTNGPAAVMAQESGASQRAALGALRAENNDLQRRLGDLRWDEGSAGAWVRTYGGESEIKDGTGSDVNYHGIQVGYDRARALGDGRLFTGIALSNMKGSASGSTANCDFESNLFGVYGSYVGKRGHFVDAIVKYGRMSNDASHTDSGVTYTGDYAANGLNMSLEYGYRKNLNNGFYLEPQAELNYGHIDGSSYTMQAGGTSGAVVNNNSTDSLVARVGINAGRTTKDGNVYLKLSGLHEFNGDTGMTANYSGTTVSSSSSGSDTWLEYGVGFDRRIANNQNLYGEISRSAFADKVSDKWKANLGWRVSF